MTGRGGRCLRAFVPARPRRKLRAAELRGAAGTAGAARSRPQPPGGDSRLLRAGTLQPCSVRGAHGTSLPALEWRLPEVPASSLRCGGSRGALKEFCQRR